MWAIALSADGQYLASTSYNGRLNVWDTKNERKKFKEYETKGSYGMCIDLVGTGWFHHTPRLILEISVTGWPLHSYWP